MLVDFAIAKRPSAPDAVPAQVCLTPRDAPVALWGRLGLQGNQVAPTLDGHPQPNRVAVWFRPPAGERHGLLSQLPAMMRRAAVFRPGIVGPWTYWAILALTPLLALAGVRLLARAAAGRPLRRDALAIGAIAFALAASWALITPPFDAPDETENFAYAQTIAENGRAPQTTHTARRPYSHELQVAYEGAQVAGYLGQTDGRPPWLVAEERAWQHRAASLEPSPGDGGGIDVAAGYTPLYYAALAPAYLAADHASIWSRLTLMRLVSALLGAVAAAATVLLVRELLPRHRWAPVAAGLLVAFQPMLSFVSGAVNNDAGVDAAGAVLLWLLVRALRRGMSARLGLAIGAALVLAPLAKGNGLFLYPAAAIALAGVAWRRRPGLRPFAAVAVGFALVAAAWTPISLALHHDPLPGNPGWNPVSSTEYPTRAGAKLTPRLALEHPGRFATYLWEAFLPPVAGMEDLRPTGFPHPAYTAYVKRGWASFGLVSIEFPGWVYAMIATGLGVAALLGIVLLVRERTAVRRRGWELATLVSAPVVVLVGSEAVYFFPRASTLNVFGRYLFPAIAALAALAVAACLGAGRRWAPAVAAAAVVSVMALQWASQLLTMSSLYA
jgi:4-amino-4-deoxy-L-arabinose transferase-like glycosyltransferase